MLYRLEHLAPEGRCRFCKQQAVSPMDGGSSVCQLGASARRFFVHVVLGLEEARSRGVSLQPVPDEMVKVCERSLLGLTLARVCPKASLLLPAVLRVITIGPGGSRHVCEGADTCVRLCCTFSLLFFFTL